MLALLCRQPCFVDGPTSVNALRACISRKSDGRLCAMLTFYEPLSLDPSRAAALCAALPALPPRRDSRERRAGPGSASGGQQVAVEHRRARRHRPWGGRSWGVRAALLRSGRASGPGLAGARDGSGARA